MPTYALGPKKPRIHRSAVLAPNCTIIGDVVIGPGTSIWPGAVIRGDYGHIRIGSDCSIQDNVVVHCSGENPAVVGKGVTVAHGAIVHACRIGDECLIGAGAIVFDGATIGKHSILGVGSILLERRKIPPRSVAVGGPGKKIRKENLEGGLAVKGSYTGLVEKAPIVEKTRNF